MKDANIKDLATAVGLMCFPAGLEGPEPLVGLSHWQILCRACRGFVAVQALRTLLKDSTLSHSRARPRRSETACHMRCLHAEVNNDWLPHRQKRGNEQTLQEPETAERSREDTAVILMCRRRRPHLLSRGMPVACRAHSGCGNAGLQEAQPAQAPRQKKRRGGGSHIYTPANLLTSWDQRPQI